MRAREILRALLAIACALPGSAQELTETESPERTPVFIVEDGAPPGFENLDIPQRTLVDVAYGGRALEPAPAIYTESTIRFVNPEAVVAQIDGLTYPDAVVEALTGKLPANRDLACVDRGVPEGCGVLSPETAGVIFDADRFQVEIFVSKRLLRLATINEEDRLPPPSDEWTGLATLGGGIAGTSEIDPSYSFRAATLVARGATHLDFIGDLQTGGRFLVDRLALNHDWEDWQFTGGLYRSTPFRVLGETEVVGFRARSSLRTRTRLYLDRAYGSRMRVFLLRRSLVQIFRDGRLLANRVYDVGNQEIDTSELPSGAYDVDIVITDPVSGRRSESQFFAKTTDLPPLGQIHFLGEAGVIRQREDASRPLDAVGAPFVRAGAAMRVTPRFGFDFDMALIDQDNVFTAGVLWLGETLVLRTGPIVTSRGAAGAEFIGAFEYGDFIANANLRGIWGNSSTRFIRSPSTDFSWAMAYTWENLRFSLRGDVRTRSGDPDTRYSVTPSVQIPLFRRAKLRGDLRAEYTHSDRGHALILRVDLAEWWRDFQSTQSVTGRYDETGSTSRGTAEGDVTARWRSPASFPADLQADVRASRRRDRTSLAVSGDVRSHRGAATAYLEETFPDEGSPETLYGAQWSIGLVGDRRGVVASGEGSGTSAVLVEVSGDYENAVFEIYVNDVRSARVAVGQAQLVALPPYGEYRVRLVSLDGQSLYYDTSARTVVLYPGSSARLHWAVRRLFVLVSAVAWADGSPVVNGRVYGAVGEAATDESGFLQADVTPGVRLRIETQDRRESCVIEVPENPAQEDFIVVDELVCQDEAERATPAPGSTEIEVPGIDLGAASAGIVPASDAKQDEKTPPAEPVSFGSEPAPPLQ